MDSYVKFKDYCVKLGALSAAGIDNPVLKELALSISNEAEGVEILFKKLTEEVFAQLTQCFDSPAHFGEEGYLIDIGEAITIYYTAEISKIYALYAIKRHYEKDGIKAGIIYNTPKVGFRCALTHLPGRKAMEDYKKFIDMLLAFGHNTLMIEIGGAMEYKRYPEISQGWLEYCKFFKDYNAKIWGKSNQITRIHIFPKNSIGIENADGEYLTHEELGEIVEYCRVRHMEIIPNVPSFCHSDYILFKHPELAECPDEPLPSNVCPSNEDYYKIIFDILDEVIEVFGPKRINICHDEAYVYGHCPKCKGKKPEALFGGHIIRLHDYLAAKGVRTMVWGDGLINTSHGGAEVVHMRLPWDGERTFTYKDKTYPVREFEWSLSMEEWEEIKKQNPQAEGWHVAEKYKAIEMMPKDLEVMNWSWSFGEDKDEQLIRQGLYNVYGNFNAMGMKNFDERIAKGVSGVSYSAWSKSDLESLQRTGAFFGIAYNSYACWNRNYDESCKAENSFLVAAAVYKHFNYDVLGGKHLEITHTTNARIEHPTFLDGYHVISKEYYIGEYEITYTDGTVQVLPVYWGYNIGSSNVIWGNAKVDADVSTELGGYSPKYRYEPIGASKPVQDGKKTNYVFAVPIEKDVASVQVKAYEGYQVELLDWKVFE